MMTHEQRGVQIWSVLVLAARNQQILSYQTVEFLTGVPAGVMAPILGKIEAYCDAHKLPKLTALVVNQRHGVPGYLYPGFIDTPVHPDDPAHAQKANDPNPEVYTELFKEQSRVFVYDWLKNKAPSEADF
jgi:hypothetical protein